MGIMKHILLACQEKYPKCGKCGKGEVEYHLKHTRKKRVLIIVACKECGHIETIEMET
jgi:DNA-directed RNA polymerase subunit M/transcription elongation factor TFIIS